jgi:hypothetical protein
MISVRYGVLTVALLAIGGCAPATYSQQGYSVQPGTVVHDSGYNTNAGYGGGFGTGECRST